MKNLTLLLLIASLATTGTVFAEKGMHRPGGPMDGERHEKIFQRMDKNEDGQITPDEFKAPKRHRLEKMDMDGDQAVTLEEMKAAQVKMAEKHRQKMEQHMEERFNKLDIDGNGSVTSEEARTAMFSHLDKDGDGMISEDEFKRPQDKRQGGHRMYGDGNGDEE